MVVLLRLGFGKQCETSASSRVVQRGCGRDKSSGSRKESIVGNWKYFVKFCVFAIYEQRSRKLRLWVGLFNKDPSLPFLESLGHSQILTGIGTSYNAKHLISVMPELGHRQPSPTHTPYYVGHCSREARCCLVERVSAINDQVILIPFIGRMGSLTISFQGTS